MGEPRKLGPDGMSTRATEELKKFQLEDYIPYLLHQAHLAMLGLFAPVLAEHELTLPEWRVLAALHSDSPMRFRDLVTATGLEPPTLVRVVAKLEKQSRLTREKSDEDRRGTLLAITTEGRAITSLAIPRAYEAQALATQDFSADETELLRRLLRRIPINAGHNK